MHARLRCGMNRAGHRHQLWRARTEQQQQVVVGAPGDLRDGASSTSEGRAAEPSLGSASMPASIIDGWESSAAGSDFSFLGRGMPMPRGRGIFTCRAPRAQGAHGRRQQDRPSCGGGHPPQDGAGGGRIPMRELESSVPADQLQRCRVSGALHGMATREKASQGGPLPRLLAHLTFLFHLRSW